MKNNKLSSVDLAYSAGIIDGEGCIKIYKVNADKINRPNNRYTLNIQVTMVDKKIVYWFKKCYGGYFYFQKINVKKHPNWRDRYRWTLQNQRCKSFLLTLLPFLKLKQKQAKLALRFLNIKPGNIKLKHKYWNTICSLNKIGRH